MQPPRPPEPEARRPVESRRTEILQAALDLFSNAGFHGTTVRQIARLVKVNEATLYHYFPSKDAILVEVIQHVLASRRAQVAAAVPPPVPQVSPDPAQQATQVAVVLRSVGEAALHKADEPMERKLTRLLMSEGPRLSTDGRIAFEEMQRDTLLPAVQALRQLESAGLRLPLDAELLVLSFIAPLILWKLTHVMGDTPYDQHEGRRLLEHQVRLVTYAVRAGRPDPAGAPVTL